MGFDPSHTAANRPADESFTMKMVGERYSPVGPKEDIGTWHIRMTDGEITVVTGALLVSDSAVAVYRPGQIGQAGRLFWAMPGNILCIVRVENKEAA